MSRPAPPAPSEPPGRRFVREIGEAVASGKDVDRLVLRLTLMDASKVKRDPDLPLDNVSFSPEGMRLMGVRVVQGGVRTSCLGTADDVVAEPPPVAPPKPKARAKKAASAAKV